ncbi:MAG: DNA-protecting protein DprA [Parcubacteria group bacterium CG11_big_fil_rev_8_21_14_0_20_39_22]|nr:MAG: DNA-protecting protein DprA [Parcubacteria group bacterium CG11_big_fil_rev_8_21_14_0_20_39_22]
MPVCDFPKRLLEIPEPPKKLYIKGTLPDWDRKFLAVVGSRKYTSYGKRAVETLISGLRGKNVTIVSGLALGIDGVAHRAALSANLPTIAIPGSGLSEKVIYPASNAGLARKICECGGTLLSEYDPDFKATNWSFPRRNRVMAGLADAVFVIEAEQKSGTLITSRLATEYNRDVLTIPHNIFSPTGEGPHMLIRLGATPIRDSAELAEALGLDNSTMEEKDVYGDCSPEELSVITILDEPKPRDYIIGKINIPVSDANALLALMEIKGLIKEEMGEIRKICNI